MNAAETVDMLNKAVTKDPSLWALFDVIIPCNPSVGDSPIELYSLNPNVALATCLGVVNAIFDEHRIVVVTENVNGYQRRRFAAARINPTSEEPRSETGEHASRLLELYSNRGRM